MMHNHLLSALDRLLHLDSVSLDIVNVTFKLTSEHASQCRLLHIAMSRISQLLMAERGRYACIVVSFNYIVHCTYALEQFNLPQTGGGYKRGTVQRVETQAA